MRNPRYAGSSAPSTKNIAGTYPAGYLVYVHGVHEATLDLGTSQRTIKAAGYFEIAAFPHRQPVLHSFGDGGGYVGQDGGQVERELKTEN